MTKPKPFPIAIHHALRGVPLIDEDLDQLDGAQFRLVELLDGKPPPFQVRLLCGLVDGMAEDDARKLLNGVLDAGVRGSVAARLVAIADSFDAEFFHDPANWPYVTLTVDGHQETYDVQSNLFADWLSGRYYKVARTAPSKSQLEGAVLICRGQALHDGSVLDVHVRVADARGRHLHRPRR